MTATGDSAVLATAMRIGAANTSTPAANAAAASTAAPTTASTAVGLQIRAVPIQVVPGTTVDGVVLKRTQGESQISTGQQINIINNMMYHHQSSLTI